MKKVSILGLLLVIVMLVPGMISCSGETSGSSATTYTTQASPTVVVKTVPVPVTHTVIVPAHLRGIAGTGPGILLIRNTKLG
jgi:hypothetical protein